MLFVDESCNEISGILIGCGVTYIGKKGGRLSHEFGLDERVIVGERMNEPDRAGKQ